MKGPLSGVRILDLSRAIAGPYGSMMLADLGAEVIKIEAPDGDISRRTGVAQGNHKGESYFFLAFNRNKKGLVLDLATETGREVFHDLVKVSDVVWDNFRAGAMQRLQFGYEALKPINPRIITCSISGFGSSGPYRDRPSFDLVALALSGVMSITGEKPGDPPLRPGPAYGDLVAGILGVNGVVAALYERDRTGVGQPVEVSLLDGQVSNMAYHIAYYLCSGNVPQPIGSYHMSIAPYGAYNTKEGYLVIGSSWPRIARVLGLEWMIDDPRFKERGDRGTHIAEVNALIQEALMKERAEDWLELFYAEDIPAAPVKTVDQTILDPQVQHNDMIIRMPHPLGGEVELVGNPIKMPHSIIDDFVAPPLLGQHNEDILVGLLCYSDEKIRRLRQEQSDHWEKLEARIHKAL
ncbi:MAG: CoA transferase [Dehalococcoidia bacterium]|nr:CoA transferase [Dehalococcoidia bacterium]